MTKMLAALRKNIIIYVEIMSYLLLLGLNIFTGYNLYRNVVLDVRPGIPSPEEPAPVKIVSLNTAGLEIFEEDQTKRKFFVIGIDEIYTKRWGDFENPVDPFLR